MVNKLTAEQLRSLARLGAMARLLAIGDERKLIIAEFPELADAREQNPKAVVRSLEKSGTMRKAKPHWTQTARARAYLRRRMKAQRAEQRKATQKKAALARHRSLNRKGHK